MPIFGSVATWDTGPEVPDACILFGVSWCLWADFKSKFYFTVFSVFFSVFSSPF